MFRNWGFLLSEIWVLLALAALIGLIAGWLIWGRRPAVRLNDGAAEAEARRLRTMLEACEAKGRANTARISGLESDLATVKAAPVATPAMAAAVPAAAVIAEPVAPGGARKPAGLAVARGGKGDDLKLIKGVGPKLETLLHKLGFWHFDQISAWTAAEIAWVDENLEGFKGRVTRDEWVVQARDLAAGKPPRPGGEN